MDLTLSDDRKWSRATRRHVHAPEHEWFAVCSPGVEGILAAEMKEIGLHPTEMTLGGVTFMGKLADGYLANLRLRTAGRILVRLATFTCRAPEDIVNHARKIPWEAWISSDIPLKISAVTTESRINSTGLVANKVVDAIADRLAGLGQPMVALALKEDSDFQRLQIRLESNKMTVSLDSTGENLHRRGYRVDSVKAPIRETLAASILLFAGYDGTQPLCDPMCGSGTFPIEAALIGAKIAPGQYRDFQFQKWPSFRPATWDYLLKSAKSKLPATLEIYGFDRNERAILAAKSNVARADLATFIQLEKADFMRLEPPSVKPGLVVMNPPYGLRLQNSSDVVKILNKFGTRLANAWKGWRYAIVLPPGFEKLNLPIDSRLLIKHGGLNVTVVAGEI